MASLESVLHVSGYDLIDGIVRNHRPLQLWFKKNSDPHPDLRYQHISHAYLSTIPLPEEVKSPALDVTYENNTEFKFNIGLSFLEDLLKSLGLGAFDFSAKLTTGKKVSISYNNAEAVEYAAGSISGYLSDFDYNHPNPELLTQSKRDNVLVITGVVYAKNLKVKFETNLAAEANLTAELNAIAKGKFEFSATSASVLEMNSAADIYVPIAVKAYRLYFDSNGDFNRMDLITDTRSFF